ncbi:hypothetical protein V6U81_01565 [Micromonospora sp. CPCC 205711]|uniref:hypothetical protein n=1 Tax=Micromonospora sp. CPCC 205547 TaxID=3122400 RepID=UPI002FEEF915
MTDALTELGRYAPTVSEIRDAYLSLHKSLSAAYVSAFRLIANTDRGRYVETFRADHQKSSKVLTEAVGVLRGAREVPGLVEDLAKSMQVATAVCSSAQPPPALASLLFLGDPSVGYAQSLLGRSAGPFQVAFERYLRAAAPRLLALGRGKPRPFDAPDSPLTQYQAALAHLVVANFAFLAVYAALPARALYESVDGNAGARAAVTKLGGHLRGADGRECTDADLLGFVSTAGSLSDFETGLWLGLGVNQSTNSQPLAGLRDLSTDLLLAEVGREDRKVRGLAGDALEGWKLSDKSGNHLPSVAGGGVDRFNPTWPRIVERSKSYVLSGSARRADPLVVMHAMPGTQLGLLVAASLYKKAARFVVPSNASPPDLPAPTVNAGSLEFGGRHQPHDTHRSGAEIDLDLTDLPNLKNFQLPRATTVIARAQQDGGEFAFDAMTQGDVTSFMRHVVWFSLLKDAINAAAVGPGQPFDSFRPPNFDSYATADPDPNSEREPHRLRPPDSARTVAQARAFGLSVLLSGTSWLLFGDPWVFVDCFRRLNAAHTTLEEKVGKDVLRPLGWPDVEKVRVEPYVHHNHWHAEWKLRLDRAKPREPKDVQTAPGPDVFAWAPVWRALGLELQPLKDLLAEIGGQSPVAAPQCKELISLLERRWSAAEHLPDLFGIIYGGDSEGDRELLRDTDHTGSP